MKTNPFELNFPVRVRLKKPETWIAIAKYNQKYNPLVERNGVMRQKNYEEMSTIPAGELGTMTHVEERGQLRIDFDNYPVAGLGDWFCGFGNIFDNFDELFEVIE